MIGVFTVFIAFLYEKKISCLSQNSYPQKTINFVPTVILCGQTETTYYFSCYAL